MSAIRSRFVLAFVTVAVLAAVMCPGAGADVFGAIGIASDGYLSDGGQPGAQQQALYAHDPVVSGNGRYVAFDGYFGGLSGVWRRDVETGEVQPVAVGAQEPGSESCAGAVACDAELPSISADGSEISFTTRAPLSPGNDHNVNPDVYVRDMDIAASEPCEEETTRAVQHCAFTLASAISGHGEGLTYTGEPGFGAIASGRTAISADGTKVVFVTTAVSDLAGCDSAPAGEAACAEEAAVPATAALQVGLRDLSSGETQLVSARIDPATGQPMIPNAPVSVHTEESGGKNYGAVGTGARGATAFPFSNHPYSVPPAIGASISADGTTVAWLGTAIGQQAPTLSGEAGTPIYEEPLWRRVADGPLAPTLRVTGGSEPQNPACLASGEATLAFNNFERAAADPCQGPFMIEAAVDIWNGSFGYSIPQLSADGSEVAFAATAQPLALGNSFGQESSGRAADVFVSNMSQALTRKQALTPVTQEVGGALAERARNAPIVDFAISPDGTQVAFATERTQFPLNSLTYVSQPAALAEMSELFDVDLSNHTLTRVSAGYLGGPSEHPHTTSSASEPPYQSFADGALSPSFSTDGNELAFSSTASNLAYGDGNTPNAIAGTGSADGGDAFVVQRRVFPPVQTETSISQVPPNPAPVPQWRLGVTGRALTNGTVRLYVQAPPAAGQIKASATGVVSVLSAARRAHGSSRSHRKVVILLRRRLATAQTAAAPTGGTRVLTLKLAARYRRLAARPRGLAATVVVVVVTPGHPTLKQTLNVNFRVVRRHKGTHR